MRNYFPRITAIFSLTMLTAMALLAVFGGTGVALADAIVTNCSSYGASGGLQAAIAGGGTITFQCSGTITVPEIGVSNTLTLNGNGYAITLSGNNANRVFSVTSGGNLTLKGLTISNGYVKGAAGDYGGDDAYGGGIFINGGTANLINTTVSNNRAIGGNTTAPSYIPDAIGAYGRGAGIGVKNGTLSLLNSTIANNTATGGNASGGTNFIAGGNGEGGGIYLESSNASLTNTTIANNQAIGGNAGPSPTNSSFGGSGNDSGMSVEGSTATLLNVTIVNNHSSGGAGVNYTGYDNVGGLGVYSGSTITLTNSLIANNIGARSGPDVFKGYQVTINWQGYNLLGNSTDAGFIGDATTLTNTNPLLDTAGLKDNGGPTFTVGLQAGSPALDKIPVANCPTSDQRYASRSGLCDIGAFELNGTLPQLSLNPASLPNGTLNQAYNSQNFSATGGTTPYNFYVSSGTLPTGLTLSSGGLLSGTPVASGSFSFTVRVADNNNFSATKSYTIVIPDTVAPSASPTQSPAANADGWNNSDVTVSWNWKDNAGGSGIDSANCTTSSTSSGEGAAITLTATCKDKAGNPGNATYTVKVDKTPPTISVTRTNADGSTYTPGTWTNQSVTITFTCSDTLSGFLAGNSYQCGSDTSGSSGGSSFSIGVSDLAGNSASAESGEIKIDKEPPTVTASAKNADGTTYTAGTWTSQAVTVSFSCNDDLSGLSGSCPASVTISTPGITDAVSSGTVKDNVGNSASASFGPIKIGSPLSVVANLERAPDNNGWYNAPVKVTFVPTGGAGSVSCDAPITYSGPDSATASVTGSCSDQAGQRVSASTTFKYDATKPTITASAKKADGSAYTAGSWANQNVTVHFSCSDNLAGIFACPADATISAEGTTASVYGNVSDLAGNSNSTSFGPILIDKTAPVVTATPDRAPDSNGWYNHAVSFSFSGNDGSGSGGVTCDTAKNYSGPDSATASVTGKCTDAAGNVGSASPSFKYDATKPTSSISVPSATSYILNQVVTVSFSCTDPISGIDTCVGTVANGGKLDTASVGSKSFTVTAKDKAGNTYSQSVNYTVGYKVCLLYDPEQQAKNPGSTMPVKLQLCDASGKSVSSSSLTLTAINVDGKTNLLNDSGNANPGNRFVYSSGYYQYNLKVPTSGLNSSKQHYLSFTVSGDTTNTYTATFYTK